jgi:hypothetical protein
MGALFKALLNSKDCDEPGETSVNLVNTLVRISEYKTRSLMTLLLIVFFITQRIQQQ